MDNLLLLFYMGITNINTAFHVLQPFIILFLKVFNVDVYKLHNKDKINNIRYILKDSLCMYYTDVILSTL
jgi:hypothetical protein